MALLKHLLAVVTIASTLLVRAATPNPANVPTCCHRIGNHISGQVLYPQSNLYNAVNAERWSEAAILQPSCIVLPTSADDVSNAVKVPKNNDCPFAVKSGGHESIPGANDISAGVSLDLSWVNLTTLNDDRSRALIGGGATWGSIYETLEAQGLAVPGGLCYSTGVGGLTLGGGISVLSPKTGFTADAVQNFQVVLASGDMVNANAQTRSDLFKALKGGGSNFGIVTRFDFSTLQQGDLWGGMVYNQYNQANVNTTMSALDAITTANNNDQDAAYASIFVQNSTANASSIVHWLTHTDNAEDADIFSEALSIEPNLRNTLRSTTLSDLAAEGVASIPFGFRYLMATVTFRNDVDTLIQAQRAAEQVYSSVQDVAGVVLLTMYEPLPKIFWQRSAEHGGNVLGLEKGQDDLIVVVNIAQWTGAADDRRMHDAASQWVKDVKATSARLGTANDFVYLNFADSFQNPLASYSADSVAFMKQVAEKYDPNGVFQDLMPGGFKLKDIS